MKKFIKIQIAPNNEFSVSVRTAQPKVHAPANTRQVLQLDAFRARQHVAWLEQHGLDSTDVLRAC